MAKPWNNQALVLIALCFILPWKIEPACHAEEQVTPATAESKELTPQDLFNEIGGLLQGFGQKKELGPHRFRQLKVDHQRARAEYAELLKIIPVEKRIAFPGIDKQKNAYPGIKAARAKFVELAKIYKDPEAAETIEYVEYLLGEASESAIPWESDEDFDEIKRWLDANDAYTRLLTETIQQADYCNRLQEPGLVYDEKIDDFDVVTIRECLGFLQHRLLFHCRAKDWNAAQRELSLMVRCCELQYKTRGFMIDYMMNRGIVSMVWEMAERMLRQPELPLTKVPKILDELQALAKAQPPLADYLALEVQLYGIAKIAQIPILKNARDQILALQLLCYRENPPAGVQFAEETDTAEITLEIYMVTTVCCSNVQVHLWPIIPVFLIKQKPHARCTSVTIRSYSNIAKCHIRMS